MEVDEAVQTQVSKFQRITCNGSYVTDCSSNPNKLPTQRGNLGLHNQNHLIPVGDDGGGGVGRLCGWPSSRIVRVSRASGGKDRHSKVVTSKGLRDRRIRLSVSTAIEFYDLQDRLGFDQPSKAVEWLIKAASSSIAELPDLQNLSFPGGQKSTGKDTDFEDPNRQTNHSQQYQHSNSNSNSNNNNNDVLLSKSSACSSASETSKGSGSGLSLARSENRIRARERARGMAAKKEKEKESSSFTDLLTGGITGNSTPTGYSQMPQFNIFAGDNQPHQNHHFSFLQDNFTPVMTAAAGGGGGGGGLTPALNRGTLQSNLLSSLHNHHNLQRFQLPVTMVDGSSPVNFPFFIAPTISSGGADHFPASGFDSQLLQLYGGGDGGSRHSDHFKGKSKN